MNYEYGILCNFTDGKTEVVGEELDQIYFFHYKFQMGTAEVQCLRCYATNRKVAGSIPDGVIGIFH